jgi:hypothetical protein
MVLKFAVNALGASKLDCILTFSQENSQTNFLPQIFKFDVQIKTPKQFFKGRDVVHKVTMLSAVAEKLKALKISDFFVGRAKIQFKSSADNHGAKSGISSAPSTPCNPIAKLANVPASTLTENALDAPIP